SGPKRRTRLRFRGGSRSRLGGRVAPPAGGRGDGPRGARVLPVHLAGVLEDRGGRSARGGRGSRTDDDRRRGPRRQMPGVGPPPRGGRGPPSRGGGMVRWWAGGLVPVGSLGGGANPVAER